MAKGQLTGKELIADDVITRLEELDAKLLKILGTYNTLIKSAQNFRTPTQGNEIIKKRNELDNEFSKTQVKLIALSKEKSRIENSLVREQAKRTQAGRQSNLQLQEERLKVQALNREQKETAILNSSIVGAYRKLNLERTKSSKTLRDLISSEKASNKEIEKAQANFNKLDARVRKADSAVRDSTKNVGNYKSALSGAISGIRQLVGVFGLIEGIRLAFDFGREAVELAKQAKGVEFAFQRLGERGVTAFEEVKASTRGLLSNVDIKTALVDFDNFNLSLDESATLFEFLAVRSAQTGKSIDSLKDSLVEGLSKESKLRIDNLGISASELNDELSKTPNFIEAVANIAKREVAEAGDILDEAANSTEVWNASWTNLKQSIGEALSQVQGSSTVVNIIDRLAEQQNALNISWRESRGLLDRLGIQLNILTESGREANRQIVEEEDNRRKLTKEIEEQNKAYIKLNGSLAPLLENEEFKNGFSLFKPETVQTLGDINEKIKTLNDDLQLVTSREEAQVIQDKIKGLEQERSAILGVQDVKQTTIRLIEGTIAAYESDIAKQKEFINQTATTTQEILEAEKAIEQLQGRIDQLRNGNEAIAKVKVELDTSGLISPNDIRTIQEQTNDVLSSLGIDVSGALDELNTFYESKKDKRRQDLEDEKQAIQEQKEFSSRLLGELFGTFSSYYNLDLSAFQGLIEGKKASEIDYASTINSIANSILEGKIINYDIDLQKNQDTLNAILNDTNSTEIQKLNAQKKFDEEEKKIRNKKVKAERESILIQIAIDTAAAVAKALAQTGVLAPAVIPTIIGLGAAQLAFVASQPLPQFFMGKKATDNFEGMATWGEKRKEVNIDKYGGIEVSPNRTTERFVNASDIILPSIGQFDKEIKNPNSEVFKRVSKRYGEDTKKRQYGFSKKTNTSIPTKGIEQVLQRELSKLANRPIKVKVEYPDNYSKY